MLDHTPLLYRADPSAFLTCYIKLCKYDFLSTVLRPLGLATPHTAAQTQQPALEAVLTNQVAT